MSANPPILPEAIRARLLAVRDELAAKHCATQSGQAWRDMAPAVRGLLVMMALEGNDRQPDAYLALQPWQAFSDEQRNKLGATARYIGRELQCAGVLR